MDRLSQGIVCTLGVAIAVVAWSAESQTVLPSVVVVEESSVERAPLPVSPPTLVVPPARRGLLFGWPKDLQKALLREDYASTSAKLKVYPTDALSDVQKADWAFVYAWSLFRSGQTAKIKSLVPLLSKSENAPAAYRETLLAVSQDEGQLTHLEAIALSSVMGPQALIKRAKLLDLAGKSTEAIALYSQLAARPDPASGNPEALLALAAHPAVPTEVAYASARRVWYAYPKTPHSVQAAVILKRWTGPAHRPTWQEVGQRAENLMKMRDYSGAIGETQRILKQVKEPSLAACRIWYTRGRSYYKKNQLSNAIKAFGAAGERCAPFGASYSAKSNYIVGTAYFRKGQHLKSAQAFHAIERLTPTHSFADDGLTHAGIAYAEADQVEQAEAEWWLALTQHPDGDLAPESTWRLAWSSYLRGQPKQAIQVATSLGALPIENDPVHVLAGRYWAARWLLYPDVDHPNTLVKDAASRSKALDGFEQLCQNHPRSYYAILAYSRLVELDPTRAARLAKRDPTRDTGDLSRPWVVRLGFYTDPNISAGVSLARLGLIGEAKAEWARSSWTDWSADEMAWRTELRAATGDWLFGHDAMRSWLRHHPPSSLGEREPQVLRTSYPDRYWDLVQVAAKGDRYDPRLFHGLVREESNFNRRIVSHAGARGLSQLMPATAKQVAGWLRVPLRVSDLSDPALNLRIGARYLDALHKTHSDSPYLSLAAYNAGSGRVRQWLTRFGNGPVDEWVEHIPYRETRGYVKRVMGTWQTMRYSFDEGPAFYDLSAFNAVADPSR